MTLQEFRSLPDLEQVSAILEFGHLMARNVEDDEQIFLYRIGDFFVSACYSASDDQLTDIICFLEVEQSVPHFRKKLISVNPAERQYDSPNK
jgi:hypothetical protein